MQDGQSGSPYSKLSQYLPPGSILLLKPVLHELDIEISVVPPRSTKLGDYRSPYRDKGHRISINSNLNQYAFLVTLVHEIAHAQTFDKFGCSAAPHGKEWKKNFNFLMKPFLRGAFFPPVLLKQLKLHFSNLKASTCIDPELTRNLKRFDHDPEVREFLTDLPYKAVFSWRDGRKFRKLDKLRKRYRCQELPTSRIYLFSPVAEVSRIKT